MWMLESKTDPNKKYNHKGVSMGRDDQHIQLVHWFMFCNGVASDSVFVEEYAEELRNMSDQEFEMEWNEMIGDEY